MPHILSSITRIFLVLSLLFLTENCSSQKETNSSAKDQKEEPLVSKEDWSVFPHLIVTKVETEKDGEKVTLKNDRGRVYIMLMNRSELKSNYKTLKIDDKVQVNGMYSKSIPVKIFPKSIKMLQ